jgi:hypothetical protein
MLPDQLCTDARGSRAVCNRETNRIQTRRSHRSGKRVAFPA